MSTKVFILVVVAICILYAVLFRRMQDRHDRRRRPGEGNPIRYWLKGKDDDEDI